MRRYFQAHEAVGAAGLVVDSPENIRRHLNIFDGKMFVKTSRLRSSILNQKFTQSIVVVRAAGDRFLENGRVARHSANAVLFDQALELAGANEVTANIVEPNRLSLLQKPF